MADGGPRRAGVSSETGVVRVALINPNWHFEGSIYFGAVSLTCPCARILPAGLFEIQRCSGRTAVAISRTGECGTGSV